MRAETAKKLDAWLAASAEVSALRNDPGETIEEIRQRLDCGVSKARQVVKRLIEAGKARHSGFRGQHRVYMLVKK